MAIVQSQELIAVGMPRSRQIRALIVSLCLGGVLSLFLFYWELENEQALIRAEFERWASNHATVLQGRIERNLAILESVASLFAASEQVERREFRDFVQGVLSPRGKDIQALEWVPRIAAAERGLYEARARQDGLATFQFTERLSQGHMVRAGARAEYFPVYFLEPLASNELAAGYDIASNPVVVPALEQARDTGRTVFTAPYTLVQERGGQIGILALRPVYRMGQPLRTEAERRAGLAGYVVGVFRAGDMLEAAWKDIPAAGLHAALYDESESGGELLHFHPSRAYQGTASSSRVIGESDVQYRAALNVPGRRWALVLTPVPQVWRAHVAGRPYMVLLGGLLITGLIGAYVHTKNRRAAQVARLATDLARANDSLEESYARVAQAHREWVDAFDSIRDPIFLHDRDGRILRANQAYARLAGATVSEIPGKPYWEVFPKRSGPLHSCREALDSDTTAERQEEIAGEDGTVLNSRAFAALDEAGRYRYSVHVMEDITERKRAEQALRFRVELERFVSSVSSRFINLAPAEIDNAIADTLHGAGALCRADHSYVFRLAPDLQTVDRTHEWSAPGIASRKDRLQRLLVEMFAWSREQLARGQVVHVPCVADLPAEAAAERENLRAHGIQSLVLVPLMQGERLVGFLCLVSLRAEKVWAEEDIDLFKTIGAVFVSAWARAHAEEALKEADRRKDEFLAMLAHELRNPLAPIRNAVQVLKRKPGAVDDTVRWAADLVERQIAHLTRLVDDLLDVSRITTGKIQLRREPLDIRTALQSAVEASHAQIAEHRHELTVSVPANPLWVEGDQARLTQVVDNLLCNAVKYSENGGCIHLSAEREEGEVVIRVRDMGIGIPADLLRSIFDPFRQAEHSLDRSRGGIGVGLTLVRHMVELHGGRVEAFSAGVGQGSEFVVRLPALPETEQPVPAPSDNRGGNPASARRILVVDDNMDVAKSFAMLLESMGHEVRLAHDGPSALEAVAAFQPEVVLLDIGLPGMDGYEVARRLRTQYPADRLRIVAVTGYGQAEDRNRSRAAGFDCHLVKPVTPEMLEPLLDWPEKLPGGFS